MDRFERLVSLACFRGKRCGIPDDLETVTTRGEEAPCETVGCTPEAIERVWRKAEALYRSGVHPAIQLCIRRRGQVVLHRAIGHTSGNGPGDPSEAPKRIVDLDTPINIFSAAKAVTAMVVHKLAERGVLHLDDWVCEYIPGFERHGKQRISIRHVLAHRAGVPSLPREALDLDLLARPGRVVEILREAKPQSQPGRVLAYHAVTGGFILGEVVAGATGKTLREVLHEEITEPLGLSRLSYGVAPEEVSAVAVNAFTGPLPLPPLSQILRGALGAELREIVDLSNDRRFITGLVPSANVITTAHDLSVFYQCLLEEGRHDGRQVFERHTVRHATAEQSWWEIDFTLLAPIRYGLGFMLGSRRVGPFGADNPLAFGHIGFSNVFSWADPERQISVALLTTGKPVVSLHVIPLFGLLAEIGRAFSKRSEGGDSWAR